MWRWMSTKTLIVDSHIASRGRNVSKNTEKTFLRTLGFIEITVTAAQFNRFRAFGF